MMSCWCLLNLLCDFLREEVKLPWGTNLVCMDKNWRRDGLISHFPLSVDAFVKYPLSCWFNMNMISWLKICKSESHLYKIFMAPLTYRFTLNCVLFIDYILPNSVIKLVQFLCTFWQMNIWLVIQDRRKQARNELYRGFTLVYISIEKQTLF